MDDGEAWTILRQHLARYRACSHGDLTALVNGEPEVIEVDAPSGVRYTIETEVLWDDEVRRTLRVVGGIDDGSWRALAPRTHGFIATPDGTFVD